MNTLKEFIKKYFQNFVYFYRRLRYRIFVRMALSISVGLLDGFGLAMFLPLLQMVDGNGGQQDAKSMGNLSFLVTGMNSLGISLTLFNVLFIIVVFFALKGCAQFTSNFYELLLRQFFIRSLRLRLSKALSQLTYKAFILSNPGRIQNTMTGEVGNIMLAYQNYFGTFQQVVMVVVYMLFAFFVDAKFAVLICIGGGITNLVYNRIYKTTKAASKKLTSGANLYQGLIIQFVSNFKYLKATGGLQRYNRKLTQTIDFVQEQNLRIGKLGAIVSATREPLLIVVVSAVILVQVEVLNGMLSTILISLLFFYRALSALVQMQSSYNNFLAVSGSMDNMTSFEQDLAAAKEKDGSRVIEKFSKEISLTHANFSYSDASILKDINLSIHKNETVAFVGESGSGKTTLANIIAGLLPLSSGSLEVDGVSMADIKKDSYGKRIGYITQEPVIFNDTIFNNISFWAEPTPENVERFNKAIRLAYLEPFLDGLPQKEQTILGNNGVNLSGGQRQRISIARELYKEVDIIVMDEATSALDSETEQYIQSSIDNLHGEYTVIVIAHRLSTIRNADRIYLLEKGEILAQGDFEQMMNLSPKFQRMVALQEV